jgi:hypothetical protein
VGLVDHQEYAVPAGDLADTREVVLLGKDDPDVRQCRLHQQARDITLGQAAVESLEVVERHHGRRDRNVDLWTQGARPGDDSVAFEHSKGLVDRPVIAPVHHCDARSPSEMAGEPQHEPVRVRG